MMAARRVVCFGLPRVRLVWTDIVCGWAKHDFCHALEDTKLKAQVRVSLNLNSVASGLLET